MPCGTHVMTRQTKHTRRTKQELTSRGAQVATMACRARPCNQSARWRPKVRCMSGGERCEKEKLTSTAHRQEEARMTCRNRYRCGTMRGRALRDKGVRHVRWGRNEYKRDGEERVCLPVGCSRDGGRRHVRTPSTHDESAKREQDA